MGRRFFFLFASSLRGLVCDLLQGALGEMDTWLTEQMHLHFCPFSLPLSLVLLCSTPDFFGIIWRRKQCMLGSSVGRSVVVGQREEGGGGRARLCVKL